MMPTSDQNWHLKTYSFKVFFFWCSEEVWLNANHENSTDNYHYIIIMNFVRLGGFSIWERIGRVVANVHQFTDNWRPHVSRKAEAYSPFATKQLLLAEHSLIQVCQLLSYPDEIASKNSHQHPNRTILEAVFMYILKVYELKWAWKEGIFYINEVRSLMRGFGHFEMIMMISRASS